MKANYCLFWLLNYAYRNRLISRNEYIRHWKNVQSLYETEE